MREKNSSLRYAEMKKMDFTPIIDTAVKECGVKTKERADELLDAFLQWFSLVSMATPEQPLQMLRSVDRIWHAMVLNTAFYREFCDTFAGGFVDHNPLDVVRNAANKEQYARFTLDLIKKEFGKNANKALFDLRENVTCCCGCVMPKYTLNN